MTNPDEVKDKFYDDLDCVISAAPQTDKFILLGTSMPELAQTTRPEKEDWIWRCREVQQQWTPPFKEVCRVWITDHQYSPV